ncbi:MAG: hypothetical protein ABIL66_03925, partial [candidate division WOR-3 bacterium]
MPLRIQTIILKISILSIHRFESKIILPKLGYLIKIKYLTQILENIGTPGYILSERGAYDL